MTLNLLFVVDPQWRWSHRSPSAPLIDRPWSSWSVPSADRCPARRLLLRPLFPSYAFVTPVSRHWRSDVLRRTLVQPYCLGRRYPVKRSKYVKFQQSQFRVYNVTVIHCVLCSPPIQYMTASEQWWLFGGWEGRLSELFCAVLCTTVVHDDAHTYEQFLNMNVGWGLTFCEFFCF